jgi:predicted component of type VI protein secretion system
MPFVSFNSADARQIGLLTRRVLIGRQLPRGVVLADPEVSRLHAWIDPAPDASGWVVTDAGSKTGTFINGSKIYRQPLVDGDEIRVGQTRFFFHAGSPAAGFVAVDLSEPNGVVKPTGILFDCGNCGAPIWVSSDLVSKRGLCRHCKKSVTVPEPVPEIQTPPAPAPATTARKELARCAVCHGSIQSDDDITTCPECAMHFHTECWQENFGCSSYGCSQVDVLNPKPKTADTQANAATESLPVENPQAQMEPAETKQTATIVLAASVVASVLGVVMFGIPAGCVALWSIILMIRGNQKKAVLALALFICIAGIAGDLIVSDIWYYGGHHLPFKI